MFFGDRLNPQDHPQIRLRRARSMKKRPKVPFLHRGRREERLHRVVATAGRGKKRKRKTQNQTQLFCPVHPWKAETRRLLAGSAHPAEERDRKTGTQGGWSPEAWRQPGHRRDWVPQRFGSALCAWNRPQLGGGVASAQWVERRGEQGRGGEDMGEVEVGCESLAGGSSGAQCGGSPASRGPSEPEPKSPGRCASNRLPGQAEGFQK